MLPKVIIDCDPGVDDAIALIYAMRHLDVLAVTTVAGNISVEQTTTNALQILDLIEADIPVAQGLSRPWVSLAQDAKDIHGPTGLGGLSLPKPRKTTSHMHAVDLIIEQARKNPGLHIVALGPLSNVATAIRIAPEIVDLIGSIVLMGGSTGHGNVTPTAEFNIHHDPEAARAVFDSGARLFMTGLNVTEQMRIESGHIDRLYESGKRIAGMIADMLQGHIERMRSLFGTNAAVLHDPTALAPLIEPKFVTYEQGHVDVELIGSATRGMTVCDFRLEKPTNAGTPSTCTFIGTAVRSKAFIDHIIQTIKLYP